MKVPLTQGKFAIIDKDDFERVSKFNWYADKDSKDSNVFYARRKHKVGGKFVTIQMHRFILNVLDKKLQVDHKNGDTLDNRKSNLRVCTNQQNQFNSSVQKNNSTGAKGVYKTKRDNKFRVSIFFNGKSIHLGYSNSVEEGQKMYDLKAKELFGEFAKS